MHPLPILKEFDMEPTIDEIRKLLMSCYLVKHLERKEFHQKWQSVQQCWQKIPISYCVCAGEKE